MHNTRPSTLNEEHGMLTRLLYPLSPVGDEVGFVQDNYVALLFEEASQLWVLRRQRHLVGGGGWGCSACMAAVRG